MSKNSCEYSKNIPQEMYEQLKNYNTIIETSLKEMSEKLRIEEIECTRLKSEYEKISYTNESLSTKLNLAENKINFMEKQLELYETKFRRNEDNPDFSGLKTSDEKLRDEISFLSEKLGAYEKTNLEVEKHLKKSLKEFKELRKFKLSSNNSSVDEKIYSLVETNNSLQAMSEIKNWRKIKQSIGENSAEKQYLRERKFSLQKEFSEVIRNARIKKKADFINHTTDVEKDFIDSMINLAIESIDEEFKNYSEISDYMRNKIKEKYGHYYLVTAGKYDRYNSSSWSITSRKSLSFRISDLGFAIFQIRTECIDMINAVKWVTDIDIISKNELIDSEFENLVTSLALESIGKDFTGYEQMSEFMSNSIRERFGKRWFVVIGVYDSYDLSLNASLNDKRKFIELLIKDLRFTIFQAI